MLDVRPLRYFVTVARTLHFGRAAQQLHVSQPPLSRQIAALEREVGARLFERNAHKVRLTPAGEQMLADAQAILERLERIPANIAAIASGAGGSLRIGFTMCAAYSVIPGIARRFGSAYPKVSLQLREVVPNDLPSQLMEGRIDVAVMFPIERIPGIEQRRIFSEPFCAALPATHPLAGRRAFRLADLADSPFIAAPAEVSPNLRHAIEAECAAAGFAPRVHMEVQLQQTILSLVAEGVGVALVPASMMKMRVEGVKFRRLTGGQDIDQVLAWAAANQNPCLRNLLERERGATASVPTPAPR